TGTAWAVSFLRAAGSADTGGRSSRQNRRTLDMPRLVARRTAWNPSGASLGTSSLTRSFVGSLPLLLSVGIVAFARGMLVRRPAGSARLVPVRVSSRVLPRAMPRGRTGLSVGAAGLGAGAGGCWARAAGAASRTDRASNAAVRRQRLMALLIG